MKIEYEKQKTEDGRRKTEDRMSVLCLLSSVLYISLLCCLTVFGDETVIDELDPITLLAANSTQSDNEIFLPDIRVPLHTILPDFGVSRTIANSAANFAAAIKDELSQTNPLPTGIPAGQLERQPSLARLVSGESRRIWKDNVSPPDQGQVNNRTDELKQIIEQIRSIQFESQQIIQHSPDTTPAKEPQPNTNASVAEHAETAEKKIIESSADSTISAVNNDKSMSSQTLHKVEELLKDPNSIANPLELAEVLFQSGRPDLAGLCYKKALVSIASGDPNVASERAWILFQIGNCLKDNDPNASKESYAELIRTAPGSPWAQIAKSRHSLIDWYQQERPDNLIEELKR